MLVAELLQKHVLQKCVLPGFAWKKAPPKHHQEQLPNTQDYLPEFCGVWPQSQTNGKNKKVAITSILSKLQLKIKNRLLNSTGWPRSFQAVQGQTAPYFWTQAWHHEYYQL